MSVDLTNELKREAVITNATVEDWRDAIRLAGRGLVATGATTEAYTDEMIETVEKHGPYIVVAPGFALAHSRPSPAVSRTGLSWVSLVEPVEFGHSQNDPVDLVVGLAALDHTGHLEVMSALAAVLSDDDALAQLRAAGSPEEVLTLLGEHSRS